MKRAVISAALGSTLVTSGCRLLDKERVCTLELRSGVSVSVRDSTTGAFAASGAKLVVRDGAYADSVSLPATPGATDAMSLGGAGERPGVYSLTVTKPGYRDWVKTGVRVTKGDCHVNTVALTALLQP